MKCQNNVILLLKHHKSGMNSYTCILIYNTDLYRQSEPIGNNSATVSTSEACWWQLHSSTSTSMREGAWQVGGVFSTSPAIAAADERDGNSTRILIMYVKSLHNHRGPVHTLVEYVYTCIYMEMY